MQNAVNLIFNILNNDSTLITLLGNTKTVSGQQWNRIYQIPNAPYPEELPRITMFEVINDDAVSADNKPLFSDINIRIDIWLKEYQNLFAITKRVKKIITDNFKMRRFQIIETLFESDTKVYHKPINIYLLLEQESEL